MKRIFIVCLVVMLSGCFGGDGPDASRDQETKGMTEIIIGAIHGALVSKLKNSLDEDPISAVDTPLDVSEINGMTPKEILIKYWPLTYETREEFDEKSTAKKLEKEARELIAKNKYDEAMLIYEKLSSMPSGKEAAETAMIELIEKMDYIDKVEITEFIARRIETDLGKSSPAVRISLKNTGNRSLDKVTVLVYFNNHQGSPIFEESFNLVNAAHYSLGGDNKPLKPGYIKEMSEGQYYVIDSALSEWEEGNAVIKIADLEFSK